MARLPNALSSSSQKAYLAKFRVFIALAVFLGWDIHQVNSLSILTFLEFLTYNAISPANLCNYLTAVKTMFVLYGLPTKAFEDPRISYYVKSTRKLAPLRVTLRQVFTTDMLLDLCKACDSTPNGKIFKAAYLLGFFAFLRLANLVPHARKDFSIIKHLCRGDIIFKENRAIVMIKWSKTLQSKNTIRLISVPRLGSVICPVAALKKLLKISPGDNNTPLFQILVGRAWFPLTDSAVRKHLKWCLSLADLSPSLTFHALGRSGATFAFNHNVSLQNIKRHGTWTSDCVWRYIVDSHDAGQGVSENFKKILDHTS